MQEGTRLHKKIQKSMGSFYSAEVPMTMASRVEYDGDWFEIVVEGRADGVMTLNGMDGGRAQAPTGTARIPTWHTPAKGHCTILPALPLCNLPETA